MFYIFDVLESNYFKFAWTERPNAYDRIQSGFWTNVHPGELCQKGDAENPEKLAPSNLIFIFLFEGNIKLESAIKSVFPAERGEFWRKEDLIKMIVMLRLITENFSDMYWSLVESVKKGNACSGQTHELIRSLSSIDTVVLRLWLRCRIQN